MLDNIKVIIFDMDGTLIDSTDIWGQIDKEFFNKRKMEVPPTYCDEIAHIGLKQAALLTHNKYGIKESPEEIEKEWVDASISKYLNDIPLKEGVYEYLVKLKKLGIHIALATANRDSLYIPCLKRLNIFDFFEVISDVEKVGAGKESPLLFDYVASKFNYDKSQIAIFEDTITGLSTAYNAGYYTVNVYDKASDKFEDEKKKCSHMSIKSFKELL